MAKKNVASEVKSQAKPKFIGHGGFVPIPGKSQDPEGALAGPGLIISVVGFIASIFLSVVFELHVGEYFGGEHFYLGSLGGSAAVFVFWLGIGYLYSFWKTRGDDRKTYLYLGLVCSLLPVVLVIFIAVGGVLSYGALAVCLIIGLFLGYCQRHS